MEIGNNTFLVTGGASGLGAATARLLTEHGARVIIADRDIQAGQALANHLGDQAARFRETDVAEAASVQRAIDCAHSNFGALHGVVHCAGIGASAKILGEAGPHSLALFETILRVNLTGTFNVMRLAAAAMTGGDALTGTRGIIITTASVAAYEGQTGQAAYAASKGGVTSLTLPAARELARHGIRVMAIAPGLFDTPMLAGLPEEMRASLADQVPFPRRLGQPSEFAALVRHIIENDMLNGEVIRLDGGLRMT